MRYLVGDRVRARRNLDEANVFTAIAFGGAGIEQGHRGTVTGVQLGLWNPRWTQLRNWFRDVYEVSFDGVENPVVGLTNRDLELLLRRRT